MTDKRQKRIVLCFLLLAALVLLLAVSLAVFWFVDRRLFKIILRIFGLAVVQLTVVGGYAWLLLHASR